MLTGNKNLEYKILNNLDDKSLVNYFLINKTVRTIYYDELFWLSRIVNRFPYIDPEILRKNKEQRSWSQYYTNDLRLFKTKVEKHDFNNLLKCSKENRLDHVIISLKNGTDINHHNRVGWTALTLASSYGHLDVVKYLIKEGADINHYNSVGWTALTLASSYGHLDVVKYLIKEGADINHQDNDGWTVLMEASTDGYLDVVKYLIKNGANINHQDRDGETALMLASTRGYLDVVEYLIKEGANINSQNNNGETALTLATKLDIVKCLKENGAI